MKVGSRVLHRRLAVVCATTSIGVAAVLVPSAPAGATVTFSNSGTSFTVNLAGTESIRFGCSGGHVAVLDPVRKGSPTVACDAVTKVTVIGDGGKQTVDASALKATTFGSLTQVELKLGDGDDTAVESPVADVVNMAQGNDRFVVQYAGVVNGSVDLGVGTDTLEVRGGAGADTIAVESGGSGAVASITPSGSASASRPAGSVEAVLVSAGAGNDTVSAATVSGASAIAAVTILGGDGNDTLAGSAAKPNQLHGGPGTNAMGGGSAADEFWTTSRTDVIETGNLDVVHDRPLSNVGGRTIAAPTAPSTYAWDTELFGGDTTAFLLSSFYTASTHPAPPPPTSVTAGGPRIGSQVLPANPGSPANVVLSEMSVDLAAPGERDDASLCVINGTFTNVTRSCHGDGTDLAVVFHGFNPIGPPTTCTVAGDPVAAATVDCGFGDIELTGIREVRDYYAGSKVRNASVRAFLDFAYRFPTEEELDDMVAKATDIGTGPAFRDSLVFTDENRGLDVDRAYNQFLRRGTDAGGRAYWIDRLAGGTRGNTLRAGLLGSDEYFTRFAGGDVRAFVTSAYRDVLGRAPDAAGLAYWAGRITSGAMTRATVARTFLDSAEARTRLVSTEFHRLVARAPVASEIDAWIPVMLEPNGEYELDASLAGSNSYKNVILG